MSQRHHQRGGSQVAGQGPRADIERLLEKGRVKDAFKQAKLCFRDDAGPENRQLLERIYLLRVKDLIRGGMPAAAAEVARHFIEFGIHDAALQGELVALLPHVGMLDEARRLAATLAVPEAEAAFSVAVADRAVRHPEQVPNSMADVRRGAERIREALKAVERQEDDRAAELLKDIPRNSPWADWRLLVRGLAAFWREDRQTALANFDRLDPQRPAHRIAAALRATWPDAPAANGWNGLSGVSLLPLERAVFGMPVLSQLGSLRRLVDKTNPKRDMKQAIHVLALLNETLRRTDQALSQRLTEILMPLAIEEATDESYEAGQALLNSFTKAAAPLAIDPNWHRLWALCWEQVDDRPQARQFWKKYAADLTSAGLAEGDRRSAAALAWWHVGMTSASLVPGPRTTSKEAQTLRDEAIEALEKSLTLDPARRETHESLISLYEEWEKKRQAADARRRLLEKWPDDVDVMRELAHDSMSLDEPERALELARRARELKPLDTALVDLEHWAWLGVARRQTVAGRFDDARASFARAESLRPGDAGDYAVLGRRALLAFKSGDEAEAEALIERAKATLREPAPLWLSLAAEAARYKVPAAKRDAFDYELRAALKKKKNGETAGKLAALMSAYQQVGVQYFGKDEHLRLVLGYLRGTSRTNYSEEDLLAVCGLLQPLRDERKLYQQMVRLGLKKFPRCPVFHVWSVEDDLHGLAGNPVQMRKRLEKALALADSDPQGKYAHLAPAINRHLAMLAAAAESAAKMAASFEGAFEAAGGIPEGFPKFLDSFFAAMSGDLDDDSGDSFDDSFFDDEPRPPRKQRKRRKAR